MGNFINTNYNKTIDNLVEGAKSRLNNPFYIYGDRKPTIVTYYNINHNASTIDKGSSTLYDDIGQNSSLRFNKIENFHLYGIEKINVNLDVGEYGLESPIEGEALILPNTIVPVPGDMFIINHVIDKPYLFMVTGIGIDTLYTGANFYKISYKLTRTDMDALTSLETVQTIKRFTYKAGNVGTTLAPLIESNQAELIDKIEDNIDTLLNYYMNLFYKNSVQNFILEYQHMYLYDPYLIEFMIRNKLFALSGNNYFHVEQAVYIGDTFALEYDHTIFKDIEIKKSNMRLNSVYPVPVDDPNSLLVDRLESYYKLSNKVMYKDYDNPINWLDMDLLDRVINNELYDEDSNLYYRNLLILYMNNKEFDITDKIMNSIMDLEFNYTKELFYMIPILVFILKSYVNKQQEARKKIDTLVKNTTTDPSINNEASFIIGE